MRHILAAAALIAAPLVVPGAFAVPAAAQPANPSTDPAIGQEARIVFPGRATIRTFRPDGYHRVYFQDHRRRWYRADLISRCQELPFALGIGIDGRRSVLDRFSTLIVGRQRCAIQSLVRVEGPPSRRRR